MVQRVQSFSLLVILVCLTTQTSAQLLFESCQSDGGVLTFGPPIVQSINVPALPTATDVQVLVDLTHPFVGSLDIDLQGANGSTVRLHGDQLGSFNDNLDLIYADSGITNGSAAYTCECLMQPSGPGALADLVAGSVAGDWTLTAEDNFTGDNGDLSQWCLFLFAETPPPPVTGLTCLSTPGTGFADITWTNPITYDSINISVNGALTASLDGDDATYTTPTFPTPSSLTVEVEGVLDGLGAVGIVCTLTLQQTGATTGPDVVLADCPSIASLGALGGIRSYALGSFTCNRGPENLTWGATSPLMAMNAYRLNEGRLEQIGMSWVKNGTVAAAINGCGQNCNGQGGSVLGAGCLDVYSASFNGTNSVLGPRSQVNAFSGDYPGPSGTATNVLDKRLQIAEQDLMEPLAQYFVEGVFVAFEDAANGNAFNNASYKAAEVASNFEMTPTGAIAEGIPAIVAWADHGLGPDVPDPSVQVQTVDVPSEGRFYVASKVVDLGAGNFRYEYAVYNLNSHRSGGSFSVPLGLGAIPTNVGFHDVDYHTGEPYDNTDWNVAVDANSITWSSPQTFDQNPNSNALRWATLYNFWFDAVVPPSMADATLGLFRPGTPNSVSVQLTAPTTPGVSPSFIRGDANGDFQVNATVDGVYLLTYGFSSGPPPPCFDAADVDDDGILNALTDSLVLLAFQFIGGPPPPLPHPDCGEDATPLTRVGCGTVCP